MSLSVNELNYLIWRYLQEGGLEVSAYALQDETQVDQFEERYSQRVPLGCLVDLVQKGILYSKVNEMIKESKTKGSGSGADGAERKLVSQDIINMDFNLFSALDDEEHNQLTGELIKERKINPIEEVESKDKKEQIEQAEKVKDKDGDTKMDGDDDSLQVTKDNNASEQSKKEGETIQDKTSSTSTEISTILPTTTPKDTNNNSEEEEDNFTVVLKEIYTFPPSLANAWNPSHPDVLSWGQRDSYSGICALVTNTETQQLDTELKLLPHPVTSKDTIAVSWCPKGHSLVTASENGELRMWDANGTIRFIMALHHAPVLTIKWSEDSSHLLTLDITNKAITWDSNTGQPIQHIDYSNSKSSLPLSLSNNNSNSSSTIENSNNGNSALSGTVNNCNGTDATWLSTTKFIIPGPSNTLVVHSLGSTTAQAPLGILTGHTDCITTISYNSSLKLLVSASDDQTIRIWRGDSSNPLQILIGHTQPITYLSWCQLKHSGKWCLLSCSLDGTLRLWDFVSGECVFVVVVNDGVPLLNACLDGCGGERLAVGDLEGNVSIWLIHEKVKKQDKSKKSGFSDGVGEKSKQKVILHESGDVGSTKIQKENSIQSSSNGNSEPKTSQQQQQQQNSASDMTIEQGTVTLKQIGSYQPDFNTTANNNDTTKTQEGSSSSESSTFKTKESNLASASSAANFISSIEWNKDGGRIAVSYSGLKSSVIEV
ncbi:unnamed protein product [Ambrosiozyma monospora]|uniref:Unnamed protein product n=1 Tax=Ambrosiozyma monospora TaxID=43982 RepID=A0ACB5T5N3_AMBMO|nr:unnamed protein product [Ambrosiozyma monospora]